MYFYCRSIIINLCLPLYRIVLIQLLHAAILNKPTIAVFVCLSWYQSSMSSSNSHSLSLNSTHYRKYHILFSRVSSICRYIWIWFRYTWYMLSTYILHYIHILGPYFQKILSQTYDTILVKITLRHSWVILTIWHNWSKNFTIILS